MAKYVMALDAGTTSNRCILFNEKGEICSMAQKEFTQYYPQPGWVEHDASEIWQTQLSVARQAMKNVGATYEDIAAIGITNQRETVIVWDRKTGQPVYHAIVWQCRRTADMKAELMEKYPDIADSAYHKTGLVFDPYFSGTKLRWILNNVEGLRERAEAGELAFGTVDSWLIYKLTKGKVPTLPELFFSTSTPVSGMTSSARDLKFRRACFPKLRLPAQISASPIPSSSAARSRSAA